MAERMSGFERISEADLRAKYEKADLAELKAFASGEESDITLASGWEEEEQRALAAEVLKARKKK